MVQHVSYLHPKRHWWIGTCLQLTRHESHLNTEGNPSLRFEQLVWNVCLCVLCSKTQNLLQAISLIGASNQMYSRANPSGWKEQHCCSQVGHEHLLVPSSQDLANSKHCIPPMIILYRATLQKSVANAHLELCPVLIWLPEAILTRNARAPKQSPTSYFFEICVYKIQWMLCFYSRISGKFRNIIYSLLNLGSHWSQIQNYQLATRAHGESISCSERIPCCAADTVPSPTSSLESCWGTSTHVTLRSILRPHRMFAICMKQHRSLPWLQRCSKLQINQIQL